MLVVQPELLSADAILSALHRTFVPAGNGSTECLAVRLDTVSSGGAADLARRLHKVTAGVLSYLQEAMMALWHNQGFIRYVLSDSALERREHGGRHDCLKPLDVFLADGDGGGARDPDSSAAGG